jgi:hypothetical protein
MALTATPPSDPAKAVTWFILFQAHEAPVTRWWHRLMAPGYRHVMVARAQGPDHAITVEHTGKLLIVNHHDLPVEELVLRYLRGKHIHLALVLTRTPPAPGAEMRPAMTCVEVVKAALGMNAPWIVTPRQLARRLYLCGARAVSFPSITH